MGPHPSLNLPQQHSALSKMGDQQQFCLRWNNHGSTLVAVFDALLSSESLVDVTLFCEGQLLKAHKVVLSACSPYFQKLFAQTTDKHPIVILKDVKHDELKALIKYMYKGEVNVSQEQLGSLIKTAESLQIKGLADGGNKNGEVASSKPTPTPSADSAESSTENRNGRMGIDFPPATMASVLNTALTMPSNLSLSPHMRLPTVPPPEPITKDSDGESSPLAKKRKKMRRKSGGTPESVESDIRSTAGSPPEGSVHPFPRIPATITPLSQIQAAAAALHPIHREQLQMLRERELERERERARERDRDHDSEPGRLQIDIMKDSESKTDRERTTETNGEIKRPSTPTDNQVGSSNVDGNVNSVRTSPLQLTMRPTSELLESTPTKQPHSNESLNQGYSSDANHHSDDDDDGSSSDKAGFEYPDGAGPSTSHLNFGDSPHTPGYHGWPYVLADPSSQSEESFNPLSENTNQGIWNSDFKGGLLGPYLGTPLAPLHPRSNPHLAPPFPGLYGPPPHSWGRHSPPTSGLPTHHNECNRCGRLYKTRKGLKHHIKNECGVEPRFQCHHCDWKFKQKAHLLRHVARKHSVQREDPPYSNVPRESSPYSTSS